MASQRKRNMEEKKDKHVFLTMDAVRGIRTHMARHFNDVPSESDAINQACESLLDEKISVAVLAYHKHATKKSPAANEPLPSITKKANKPRSQKNV